MTQREKLEVNSQLDHNKSWRLFRDFLLARREELENLELGYSEDVTKLLKREQTIGARLELRSLYESFTNHVDSITITKEETNEA